MAKEFLSSEGVEYQAYDVTTDHEALEEMVNVAGVRTVPVITGCGEVIVGFDKEKLKKLADCVKS